jgi:DNA polymerase
MAKNYRVRLSDTVADEIKRGWREKHPRTVLLWRGYEDAAFAAVEQPGTTHSFRGILFKVFAKILFAKLPSGRTLCYIDPEIREKTMPWLDYETGKKAKKLTVSYMGVNSYTRQWQREYIYGGKWAENITSAVARDVMAESMDRLEKAGYPIVLSVHDEIVCEAPEERIDEAEFDRLVTQLPPWAQGLPIAAGGFVAERYRK